MTSLPGLDLPSVSSVSFPKLPVAVKEMIFKAFLEAREGRIIFPATECVLGPYLPQIRDVDGWCNESCCRASIIRTPVPVLLHICQQSRTIAQEIYKDVGQGGFFDSARDKLLVTPDLGFTRFRCCHNEDVTDAAPGPNHQTMLEWSHVQHVVYYAPALSRSLGSREWRNHGRDLQCMFRTRAGGRFVETITVLTDEIVEEFQTSLVIGWTELFGNEKIEKKPRETVLNWMDDAATFQQATKILEQRGYFVARRL